MGRVASAAPLGALVPGPCERSDLVCLHRALGHLLVPPRKPLKLSSDTYSYEIRRQQALRVRFADVTLHSLVRLMRHSLVPTG